VILRPEIRGSSARSAIRGLPCAQGRRAPVSWNGHCLWRTMSLSLRATPAISSTGLTGCPPRSVCERRARSAFPTPIRRASPRRSRADSWERPRGRPGNRRACRCSRAASPPPVCSGSTGALSLAGHEGGELGQSGRVQDLEATELEWVAPVLGAGRNSRRGQPVADAMSESYDTAVERAIGIGESPDGEPQSSLEDTSGRA
jgi:hypothetical protein